MRWPAQRANRRGAILICLTIASLSQFPFQDQLHSCKMMKLVFAFCLLLTLSNAANPAKKARSTQPKKPPAFKHPLTRMASSAAGVDTSFFFPDHSDKKIPMGEVVTVLCHFENNAKSPLNITSMMGSLNDNVNFAIYVQNYTQKSLGVIVKPGTRSHVINFYESSYCVAPLLL